MRQHQALFANFICKFGGLNMADLLKEVVLPAFTDDTMVREAYGSSFHLLDVELFETLAGAGEAPEPALAGQFVRDTVLTREQVFDAKTGQLVADEASLETSPSAFFVLLLKDHRLIYFAETRHAPSIGSFQSTMDRFLTRKHRDFIDASYAAFEGPGKRAFRKALKEKYPVPTLSVVPITNSDRLADFIKRYATLQRVDIIVHRKNDEPTTASLIESAEAFSDILKAKKTVISAQDNQGLDKDGAAKALDQATDGANETIRLAGVDLQGDRLVGENESFSVTAVIDHLAGGVRDKAAGLLTKFKELVARNHISRPAVSDERASAISEMVAGDGEA